jgi:hypothetical protein
MFYPIFSAVDEREIPQVTCKHCILYLSGTTEGRCIHHRNWYFGPLTNSEAEKPRTCSYFERRPGVMDG